MYASIFKGAPLGNRNAAKDYESSEGAKPVAYTKSTMAKTGLPHGSVVEVREESGNVLVPDKVSHYLAHGDGNWQKAVSAHDGFSLDVLHTESMSDDAMVGVSQKHSVSLRHQGSEGSKVANVTDLYAAPVGATIEDTNNGLRTEDGKHITFTKQKDLTWVHNGFISKQLSEDKKRCDPSNFRDAIKAGKLHFKD